METRVDDVGDDILMVVTAVLEELDELAAVGHLPARYATEVEIERSTLRSCLTSAHPERSALRRSLQSLRFLLTEGSGVCPAVLLQNIVMAQAAMA